MGVETFAGRGARVARLAHDGLSIADIGAQLFISQHTVAYLLREVVAQFRITSRDQPDLTLRDRAGAPGVA